LRDVSGASFLDFAEHERNALVQRQTIECAPQGMSELLPAYDVLWIRHRVFGFAFQTTEHRSTPCDAPQMSMSASDGDRNQKRAQRRLSTEALRGAWEGDEDFMDQVLRCGRVTEQTHREGSDRRIVRVVHFSHRARLCAPEPFEKREFGLGGRLLEGHGRSKQ
jgi:hypothetical protein